MRDWKGKAEFVKILTAAVREFVAEGGSIFPEHRHYTESPSFSHQQSLEKQKTTRRLVSAARGR